MMKSISSENQTSISVAQESGNVQNQNKAINENKIRILIVDDEPAIREVLAASLRDEGFTVFTAHDSETGFLSMRQDSPDIVFLDIWMKGPKDGIDLLERSKAVFPQMDFVMISGHGTIETAVKATKFGAWDFIEKPLSMDKILLVISHLMDFRKERSEKEALLNRLRKSIALLGETSAMIQLKQKISQFSQSSNVVYICGERGVGKNLVAQNIHYLSSRASHPFVEVNCALFPEDLMSYDLFGYEKEAFVGASNVQKGKVELCQHGTLYLEDISALPLGLQRQLLFLLKENQCRRVGSTDYYKSNVRIIASSEVPLLDHVKNGSFLNELYEFFQSSEINVIPLRERSDDLMALLLHFTDELIREGGFIRKQLSPASIQNLKNYRWPGNVQELKNFLERIYILTPGDFVDVHDLRFAGLMPETGSGELSEINTFREARAQFEREYLIKKLAENQGNISKTAEVIGLERSYLHRKIKTFGIESQKVNEEI